VTHGAPFFLDVWMYVAARRDRVAALALRMGQAAAGEAATLLLEDAPIVTLTLDAAALVVTETTKALVWDGRETNATFECSVREGQRYDIGGRIAVRVAGVLLATVPFQLRLAEQTAPETAKVSAPATSPSTAFASYASEDRIDVLARIEGVKKVAPAMDIFLDVMSLRSGDDWESKLFAFLRNTDVFYLFWSSHARASEWVEREWRAALKEKGVYFINPFPLESPEIAPPPKELEPLHFNSVYLSFINAERYVRLVREQQKQTK
jgi:hypothetical protein